MTIELNHESLLTSLKGLDLDPTFQSENDQIYFHLKIKGLDVPVFIGIIQESSLLQIVGYLPYHLHETVLGEAARILHQINKQLDMPGFGMDENEKLMFYRTVIPCPKNKVDENLLRMYIGTLHIACDTFMSTIGSIAAGKSKILNNV